MLNLFVWLCFISILGISISCKTANEDFVIYHGDGPQSNSIYYDKCAPTVTCNRNAIYRTANGSCNNLKNPLWGSSETPYIRLSEAAYNDGDHEVRKQSNGSMLPIPRKVQLSLFLEKSQNSSDHNNYHLSQFGQWVTHDITLLPPDPSGPERCCSTPINEINSNSPYQCQLPIELPTDDPVYGRHGRTCMEFRRAMTAANNFNCSISPQIPMNQATSYIDSSQLYGHTSAKANSMRSFNGGRLLTEVINENEYCPLRKRNGSLLCDGRDNVTVCFKGDPRINQHFGITSYSIMFTRFHNVVAGKLQQLNPQWSDEVLYQETRKFVGALNQIIVYRDYLPILLGESFTKCGLDFSNNITTKYNPEIQADLTMEFAGGAFRVPHNTIASFYNYVDKDYETVDSVKLNEWMSIPDPLVQGSKLDEIVRGMTESAGRLYTPSYNYLISNFMFHKHDNGGNIDLLSVDIQRGRDVGVPQYTKMRKWCGLPEICSFEDLSKIISKDDVKKLKKLYTTVDEIDLIVGALLELPVDGGTVGPTAQCLVAEAFYRIRFGDRYFVDMAGQPGSYSPEKLSSLKRMDLSCVICATTKMDEVPSNIFEPSRYSQMVKCQDHLSNLDLSAWRESP
ncbi:peroxidase-like [Metopolophium dirhodum]|uniref:peroxidase-like n=1 Tax=Metopolophium dirhodum TaxID=44670 RepID=UPI00298FB813|nr:peroxidase-like [Metopolophium dirhodum]XP_060868200.1 peroxidase-like [Metopolophium dirhodum]